jgi:serine protease Do
LVQGVEQDGPAAKAGVQAGDVILKFNGATIDRATDLPRIVGGTKPGTRSTMTVWRKGGVRDLTLTIAELEPDGKAASKSDKKQKTEPGSANALGLAVSDLTAAQLKELNIEGGVGVDATEGAAARAGIRAGDIILRLNNTDIKDARQFNALVSKLDTKKPALLLVRRGDASQFVIVKPH